MSELPATRQARLEYFEARTALWATNAVNIGILPAQATGLTSSTVANRKDFNNAIVARDAAKAATVTFYNSNNTLVQMGRDLIKAIKAYAATTNNPGVYALANIDPPAPPTPVPAPTVPTNTTGSVTPDGVVTLTWKADHAGASTGIFFIIERKRAGDADYTILGATVEKQFADPAANVAAGLVQYRVKAVRGQQSSEWTTPVVFNFSAGGGGALVAGFVGGTGNVAQAA